MVGYKNQVWLGSSHRNQWHGAREKFCILASFSFEFDVKNALEEIEGRDFSDTIHTVTRPIKLFDSSLMWKLTRFLGVFKRFSPHLTF